MDSSPEAPPTPAVVPDFFIAGAPKCGTTALFSYLATHPGIAPSARKEPFYWCTDLGSRAQIHDPAEYSRLWDGADPAALKMEGTVMYLRSDVAIPAIVAARPGARFIAVLRSPAELAQSYHSHAIRAFDEDVRDFEKAWGLQAVRRRGERIMRGCADPERLQYARLCALGDQLERLVALVPEENRLVLLYDDLAADPRALYLRTLEFLGLPDDGRRTFERVNEGSRYRSIRLGIAHRRLPEVLGPLYAPLRAAALRMGIRPAALVTRLNTTSAPRPRLRPAFEDELYRFFLPQVKKVETLLGRDLPHWKVPRERRVDSGSPRSSHG